MKPRQVTFKELGDTAYQRAVRVASSIRGAYVGQIPSDAGDAFDTAYVVTDAPLPVVRKLAKFHGLTVSARGGPRTISARRNPSVTVMRANPFVSHIPAGWRHIKTHKGVPIFYRLGHYTVRMSSPTGGALMVGNIGTEAAIKKLINAALKRGYAAENPFTPTARRNPPATRVAFVLSKRVIDLSYLHAEDKRRPYRHKFAAGVTCQLLTDGSVRLVRADGKPCWKNFPK